MKSEETFIDSAAQEKIGILGCKDRMFITMYWRLGPETRQRIAALDLDSAQKLLVALQEHINYMTP